MNSEYDDASTELDNGINERARNGRIGKATMFVVANSLQNPKGDLD